MKFDDGRNITLGGFGLVAGRPGLFLVRSGAELPPGFALDLSTCTCGRCDEAAEYSEALAVLDVHGHETMCMRDEFTPLHVATRRQLEGAGVTRYGLQALLLDPRDPGQPR